MNRGVELQLHIALNCGSISPIASIPVRKQEKSEMVSKKVWMVGFIALVLGTSAYATPGNNGGGNGGCGVNQQTNGCGGTTGGAGGAGGQGGAGGSGVGIGIAGASANAAAVAAQQQGQIQGQAQSSRNTNTVRSSNSNANQAMGGNSHASSGGNVLTQQGGAVNVEGDTYVAPAQERNPVATAYAAPLTATNGTCMGSSTAGGQGASFGVSFGTTWTDTSCDIRYDAEALRAAGLPIAARARLCQKPEIAKAMEAAGTPCPNEGKRAEAILNDRPVAALSLLP